MDYAFWQVILVFVVTFIAAIDQFSLLESLYQPIVTGFVIGAILGNLETGLVVGGTYQLMTIGNMPLGGAQPPNAVIGGIMAAVLACSLNLEPTAAAAMAIPFALLAQYGVTILFTATSVLMKRADTCAHNADTKGITYINLFEMLIIGLIFGTIVTLFFIGGATFGQEIVNAIPTWLMSGLAAAGLMMRFVGFAILLKVMMNNKLWGFFFIGFTLAIITCAIPALATPALLILALIGFGLAFWDFQIQSKLDAAPAIHMEGDDEDGI